MPVSRKRKKKKSGSSGRTSGSFSSREDRRRSADAAAVRVDPEMAEAFQNLMAYREEVGTRRASRAAALATDLVADLVRELAERPDTIVTDAVCDRLGAMLGEDRQSPVDDKVGPVRLAEALPAAAEAAVAAALTGPEGAWRAPWRVLTALTGVLPYPEHEIVSETVTRLRGLPSGRVLPAAPPGPEVTGPVLWTADGYGSRFAVTAAISAPDEPMRWYLWDIDACGHAAFTVHSGFYPAPAAALTAWQAAVGETASSGTVLAAVDDPWLLAAVLPDELGFMRPGGESLDQLVEYHRSKRLAEAVKQATPRSQAVPHDAGLTPEIAAVEFAAWLRARDHHELPENISELVEELADSWMNDTGEVYATCSPHRVALCVLHLRDYYLDDFADQLMALLPDWTRWLAERNATAPELADRCLPYALGQPHPQVGADGREIDYLARVVE